MHSSQMDVRFLTKQFLLMDNIARDYWAQVDNADWEQQLHLLIHSESYLSSIILEGTKERQRTMAQQALERLTRILCDKVAHHDERSKLA